jgi:hypothetical protein
LNYTRVSAQRAQSDDGSIVEVLDRQTVRYRDADLSAAIDVDFAATTGIYVESLRAQSAAGHSLVLEPYQRATLLSRIEAGLASLGVETERCGR